jgi:hypothetical protein
MTIETVWVSFADKDKFRGVAIVDVDCPADTDKAELMMAALERTIELGCNAGPDTSVQAQTITQRHYVPEAFKNRLLNADEVESLKNSPSRKQ